MFAIVFLPLCDLELPVQEINKNCWIVRGESTLFLLGIYCKLIIDIPFHGSHVWSISTEGDQM